MKPIPERAHGTPGPLRRETKSYRDTQRTADAERVRALRRSQFKKGRRK